MINNPFPRAIGFPHFFGHMARHRLGCCLLVSGAALLGGCGSRPLAPLNSTLTQQDVPANLRVPDGHQAVLQAYSNGRLLYECQAIKRSPFEYEWLVRNTDIDLTDAKGDNIKHKPGARASWAHRDGSSALSREFVEVPNGAHNLPLQTYKVEPAATPGTLQNISYVQRLRTVGGWVSVTPCTSAQLGMRVTVPYEAAYVFWRPAGS